MFQVFCRYSCNMPGLWLAGSKHPDHPRRIKYRTFFSLELWGVSVRASAPSWHHTPLSGMEYLLRKFLACAAPHPCHSGFKKPLPAGKDHGSCSGMAGCSTLYSPSGSGFSPLPVWRRRPCCCAAAPFRHHFTACTAIYAGTVSFGQSSPPFTSRPSAAYPRCTVPVLPAGVRRYYGKKLFFRLSLGAGYP